MTYSEKQDQLEIELNKYQLLCIDYGRYQFTDSVLATRFFDSMENQRTVIDEVIQDMIDSSTEEYGHIVREANYCNCSE